MMAGIGKTLEGIRILRPHLAILVTVLFCLSTGYIAEASATRELSPVVIRAIDPVPLPGVVSNLASNPSDQVELADPFEEFLEKLQPIKKVWNFSLFSIGEKPVTVSDIVVALFAIIFGLYLVSKSVRFIATKVLPRTRLKENVAASIQKILLYMGNLLVFLLALHMVNIPLTAFAFIGGALAIGVGFGAQNLINNFISGFIIMAEQPIRIGDLIEIEGNYATVEDIGARSTRIRTPDNIHILVPNSSFLEKNIINWTHSDKNVRGHVLVGVRYGSPVREVKRLLKRAADEHGKVMTNPHPLVLFLDFGDNALIFQLFFWVSIRDVMDRRIIESDIRFLIDDLFREAGIVIAFPQRDIHLDTMKALEVRVLNSPEGEGEGGDTEPPGPDDTL